jgi:hypothetical protein
MKQHLLDRTGSINCTSSSISTYKKDINNFRKVPKNKTGAKKINGDLHTWISQQTTDELSNDINETDVEISSIKNHELLVSDHIFRTEKYVPKDLLSKKHLDNIQLISQMFPGEITTFLGFETRLWEENNNADFAFAISGVGDDRKILTSFLETNTVSKQLLDYSEWKQIYNFSKIWSNSHSELYNKVQCFWLEFDMPDEGIGTMIPSVFFGPSNGNNTNKNQYNWLVESAIPLLSGSIPPKNISKLIFDTIRKMPDNSTLFQIGTMLSREVTAIRFHINKLKSSQIIPYLKDIHWNYETKELTNLIIDLEELVERFVLSFDILDEGIGPKIGIELSFVGDDYIHKNNWEQLLSYLVKKGLCLPAKKEALLQYSGIEKTENFSGGILRPIYSATDYSEDISESNIIRYINHIKIVYEPGKPLRAKAYPAIRLFEIQEDQKTKMKKH